MPDLGLGLRPWTLQRISKSEGSDRARKYQIGAYAVLPELSWSWHDKAKNL